MIHRGAAIAGVVCWLLVALASTAGGQPPAAEEPRAGHTDWGPWSFDWEVQNHTGLAVRNVRHRGDLFIAKADMPVIRVKYERDFRWWNPRTWCRRGCGPFADRISWETLQPIADCGDARICQVQFTTGSVEWLELSVFARIGKYRIKQAWYFSNTQPVGDPTRSDEVTARVFSSGLSCNLYHDHHPYWRVDIGEPAAHRVFVYDAGVSPRVYPVEANDRKDTTRNRRWLIRDASRPLAMWVVPGPVDGIADSFSTKDVGLRLYNPEEDEDWVFGPRGHLGYNEREPIDTRHTVFWYVGHLPHRPEVGGDAWVGAGPSLLVQR
jgi:hypothetical protein